MTPNKSSNKYRIDISDSDKLVEITFEGTSVSFEVMKDALTSVKSYIMKGYKVKLRGYFTHESKTLKAFTFALSLLGYENLITFEHKARYSKSVRRELKKKAFDLRKRGFTAKQISKQLNVPLKTVYRWLKELE